MEYVIPDFDIQQYVVPGEDSLLYAMWSPDGDFGLLIVSEHAPIYSEAEEEFLPMYFGGTVAIMADVHISQFEAIKDIAQQRGFVIGELLFNGEMVYNDLDLFMKDIRACPYCVEVADRPLERLIGFRSSGEDRVGRRHWLISLSALKKASVRQSIACFQTAEGREQLVQELNTKPVYNTPKSLKD